MEVCRLVYNQTLAYRTGPWEQPQEPLSLYETNALLPQWKQESLALSPAHLQGRCVRGVSCVPKNPLLYVNISVSPVLSIWTETIML